jgi:cupin fold WbuC family metalloprotein
MSVEFLKGRDVVEIGPETLAGLKQSAASAPLRRARVCLHQDLQDKVQEMVIAFCRDTYNRPHRHRDKSESFHVIEGELLVVFFDDDGRVTRRIHMGPNGSGLTFYYRMSSDLWHAVLPLSDYVIIHETTSGPFVPGDADFAPWGPDPSDAEAVRFFEDRVRSEVWPAERCLRPGGRDAPEPRA